jgi:hypothetical protein
MSTWSKDELRKIAEADDLHISPFREDGRTYGTPTWIWSVVVDDALYVRALSDAMGDGTRNISAEVIAGSDRHMTRAALTTMTGRRPLITLWARSATRSPTTPSCSRLSRTRRRR